MRSRHGNQDNHSDNVCLVLWPNPVRPSRGVRSREIRRFCRSAEPFGHLTSINALAPSDQIAAQQVADPLGQGVEAGGEGRSGFFHLCVRSRVGQPPMQPRGVGWQRVAVAGRVIAHGDHQIERVGRRLQHRRQALAGELARVDGQAADLLQRQRMDPPGGWGHCRRWRLQWPPDRGPETGLPP